MTRFDGGSRAALADAAQSIEAVSSAEVLVAVRERSGPYLHASLAAALLAGVLTLWFLLFSPWEFSLLTIQLAPSLAGLAAGVLVSLVPAAERALSPASIRHEYVRTAARAVFHDKDVSRTRGRTGILVYIGRLEREAEVVVDTGIAQAIPRERWAEAVRPLLAAARAGRAAEMAAALAALAPVLASALPKRADDVDELTEEIDS